MNELTKVEYQKMTDLIIANICVELTARNWTLKKLSDETEIPYESIKKLFGGKVLKPSFNSIWQIANALDCPLDKLTGRSDPYLSILRQITNDTSKIHRILEEIQKLAQDAL